MVTTKQKSRAELQNKTETGDWANDHGKQLTYKGEQEQKDKGTVERQNKQTAKDEMQ